MTNCQRIKRNMEKFVKLLNVDCIRHCYIGGKQDMSIQHIFLYEPKLIGRNLKQQYIFRIFIRSIIIMVPMLYENVRSAAAAEV